MESELRNKITIIFSSYKIVKNRQNKKKNKKKKNYYRYEIFK